MINQISNKGVVLSFVYSDELGTSAVCLKRNGNIDVHNFRDITILTLDAQIEEFNAYYYKYVSPSEHLERYAKDLKKELLK